MAWSLGNKRWTIPFMSAAGVSCRVDIYKRGYSGSAVTTLSIEATNSPGYAAANPFEYEENNDEDVLNGVIRYRTGYLRLIEAQYGGLRELFPSVNNEHYVEFYYDSILDFNGFIKAQEFNIPWETGPREIQLPVVSPLGLAYGTKIAWTNSDSPTWYSIKSVIYKALSVLDGDYTKFIFPQYITSGTSSVVNSLYLNSLTIVPFAGRYKKTQNSLDGIYEPKTAEEVLTMICTGFGLILHDAPDCPVFQRLDYRDDYRQFMLAASTYTQKTQGITDFDEVATIASDENSESMVMPLSKIVVEYDGDEDVPAMTFNRCHGYQRPCNLDERSLCTNTKNINDFDGNITEIVGISNEGLIDKNKIVLAAYGSSTLSEMIMFRPGEDSTAWGTGKKICSYTFFEWNGEGMQLLFKHQYGTGIEDMNNPQFEAPGVTPFYHTIGVIIKSGNKYYNTTSGWSDIPSSLIYTKAWNDGRVDCETFFTSNVANPPRPVTIEFYAVDGNISGWIHTISDVQLIPYPNPVNAYLNANNDPKTYTIEGTPSDSEGSVTRGCSIMARTMNRIRLSSEVTGTEEVEIINREPSYPYLLTAQDRIELDVKITYQYPSDIFTNRIKLWGSTTKWRAIAHSFRPWDDIHRFTLHHCNIFDY